MNARLKKRFKILKTIDFEAAVWLGGFIYLAFINPYETEHLNLCLFSLAGIENCPGCGLGKSISMIFRGDIVGSLNTHPLAIPAVILISKRVYQLIRNKIKKLYKPLEVYNG